MADVGYPTPGDPSPRPPENYHQIGANIVAWEGDESVSNWDNYCYLRFVSSGPPGDIVLTLTAKNRTVTDNANVNWGVRKAGLDHASTESSYAYTVTERGTVFIDLRVPDAYADAAPDDNPQATGMVQPHLRWVTNVRLDFPEGAGEQVYEVEFHLDGEEGETPGIRRHTCIPREGDDTAQLWGAAIVDGKPCARQVSLTERTQQGLKYYARAFSDIAGDLGPGITINAACGLWEWCEGFVKTENTAVLEAMEYEDGDTGKTRLYTCHAMDAREVRFGEVGGDVECAMRVTSWSLPPLRLCDVYAEKHLRGGHWAWIRMGAQISRSRGELHSHYRETTGDDWTYEGSASPQSDGLVTPPQVFGLYRTGISTSEHGEVTDFGQEYEREFSFARWIGSLSEIVWMLYVPEARILLYFYEQDGTIYHIFSNPEYDHWEGGDGNAPYDNPHEDLAGTSPSAYRDLRHGQIALAYISSGAVSLSLSSDWGESWDDPVSIELGATIERSSVWCDEDSGIAHVVAVDEDGNVLHAMSSDNFATLLGDVNTIVAAQSDAWPTGYTQRGPGGHGILYVGFSDNDGEQVQYASNDLGNTWEEVA